MGWRPAAALAAAAALASLQAAPAAGAQIHTVAGGGSCLGAPLWLEAGWPCDGVSATSIPIAGARSVSAIPGGGYLFIDSGDDLVREVSPSGTVTTVAGTAETLSDGTVVASVADAPDGSIATQSGLDDPVAVSALPDGSFLITEGAGCRVRLVSPGGPGIATITTIAGIPPGGNGARASCTSTANTYAAEGPATSVSLNYPSDAEPTADGGVLIADTYNHAVRDVSAAGPGATLTTIAGGPPGGGLCDDVATDCDGMAAGDVQLDLPDSVSPIAGGAGGYLVSESAGDAVRQVSETSAAGIFSTVAGSPGSGGYTGDGGPAAAAQLDQSDQVVSLTAGGFLIADTGNEVIREVSASGTISTIAGDGFASFAGDGGASTSASLQTPSSVAPLANGNILIADQDNNRIREVTIPPTATISLNPSSPNGSGGWFVTVPTVAVSANEKAAIQCELDPAAAPSVYAAIGPGCPFTGSGTTVAANGAHMVYVASQNSFGDTSKPIGVAVNVDVGPPAITCNGDPTFRFGNPTAEVTGTLSDAISGPSSETLSAPAVTAYVGAATAPLAGSNNAGTQAIGECPYFVAPLDLRPTPEATWASSAKEQGVMVTALVITNIPAGATVGVVCKGAGCPFKRHKNVKTRRCGSCKHRHLKLRMVDLAPLFAGAQLLPGTTIAVSIVEDGAVGRYLEFVVRDGKLVADRAVCLAPGATKPRKKQPCIPKKPKEG